MRILDRYILKSVFNIFILCLFAFLFLYIVIDALSCLEDILKQHISIATLAKYYLSYLPIIFVRVAPFSCLLATLYTFSNLNRNNEIIAMRAAGISIFGITKTIIIFGFITSLLVFWVNDKIVPVSVAVTQKIKYAMENKKTSRDLEAITNLSIYGLKNSLFFINKFFPKTDTMEGIIILEHDENQNIIKKIVANKGVYKDKIWVFYQAITYEFDTAGQVKNEPKYSIEEEMPISETPEEFLTQSQHPDIMTIAQLKDYKAKLSKSGAITVTRNLTVDLYQRYTAPLLSLIIIFIGIPFSLKMRRQATGVSSLGISIVLAFLYYVLNAICIALGKSGFLYPLLAASLSHILALLLGLYLIIRLP